MSDDRESGVPPKRHSRRAIFEAWNAVAFMTIVPVILGVITHSVAGGLTGLGLCALSYATTGLVWTRRYQNETARRERRQIAVAAAAAGLTAAVFVIEGAAVHHGSWPIGIVAITLATIAGILGVRAIMRRP